MLIMDFKIKNIAGFLMFNLAFSYEVVKKFAASPGDLTISQGNDKSRKAFATINAFYKTRFPQKYSIFSLRKISKFYLIFP